jgi:isoleucyl-tRNA synthetase
MSPAFGEDDYAAGKRHNLAFLQPIDARGQFPQSMEVVGGLFVKDADALLIEELKRKGVLHKAGRLMHSYPHCWRCGTPLLYYARTSWFVRTTAFRDSMLARNARVDWHPASVGEGRFGEWLTNNIDWAISRDRFWGTPLPVWICDGESSHVEAVGSFAELAEKSGETLAPDWDPHKPNVDHFHWRCSVPGCAGTMRRAPEVIDTWFDSGAMSFAQWHYPFENVDKVAAQFPADFIAEGVDQTRGWFYSLLAIATGLGDALPNNDEKGSASPYRAVVVNDMVRDADGLKMSKSRGNIIEPWAVIEKHGVDAVRLFLVAASNVWVPRSFDEKVLAEQAGRFVQEHLFGHLCPVCQFWLGAQRSGSRARGPSGHRSLDDQSAREPRAHCGRGAHGVRRHDGVARDHRVRG